MRKSDTPTLSPALIQRYTQYLTEQERATATVEKYIRDLTALLSYLDGAELTKAALIGWKAHLTETHAPASVNSMLAAVNGFLGYMGWKDLTMRPLKIQKVLFTDASHELTRAEYCRLVDAAGREGNRRLALIIQTICATGIRVSELRYITAEAVAAGRAEVNNKGKRRTIFLPSKLCRTLKQYLRAQKITAGAVFITKTGKPVNRSNVWRDMKALCESAGVDAKKVYPHNLRHLFARTYYSIERDLSRLADILGHSSVNTTRIYTAESGLVHARQVERLGLTIT